MTRCGIIAVVGAPNAGKSTLLNRLVGQRLAIVSSKPQSTRQRVVGLVTREQEQLIFTDTPGLLDPRYHLQRAMQHEAAEVLRGADLVVFVIDGSHPEAVGPEVLASLGLSSAAPMIIALNKTDVADPATIRQLLDRYPDAMQISASEGTGVSALMDVMAGQLPESPFLYDPNDASTQSVRFFVCEALREAAFEQLEEELPYAVHCEIDEFREGQRPVYIRATLYVERDSQKRILIGQGGSRIREIGRATRAKVEPLVDAPVYLDLWVKVLPNWRRNAATLHRLGFTLPKE
ncbi:MAG: GTPase Era [Gemmatimonadaceae bacterium]